MNKKLIINADDFGYDADATAAILELLELKKITSTTILANMVKPEDLEKLQLIDGISTGIHINLISGKPLSDPEKVASLIDGNGEFYPALKLLQKFISGKIKSSEIEIELTNQTAKLIDYGIKISHADSHQHIHQFPFLGKIILGILKKLDITKVRNCRLTSVTSKRATIIQLFAMSTNKHLKPFKTTDGLIPDFSFAKDYDQHFFEQLISNSFSKNNTLEIMTHPGLANRMGSYLNRKKEYLFWRNENLSRILQKNNIRLVNYNQLVF